MKLIASSASPFVRKCMVVLHETGQIDTTEIVSVSTTPLATAPEARAANPLGKIPALLREDGPALYDSRVITRFLNARVGAGLYPESQLWEILTLEATADAMMEAAVLMTYEMRFRSEALQSKDWLEAQWGKIASALEAIESRWMSHLNGPLTIAQIGVGCALGYLDLRHDTRDWRSISPNLACWFGQFSERQAMIETRPKA